VYLKQKPIKTQPIILTLKHKSVILDKFVDWYLFTWWSDFNWIYWFWRSVIMIYSVLIPRIYRFPAFDPSNNHTLSIRLI